MTRTKPSYPELQRHSPIRSLTWRWERAQFLVGEGRYVSLRWDDEETALAVRYLRALRRCRHGREERIARLYPDLHAARLLHEQGGNTVIEVQARLLARQSFDQVGRLTGLPVEVVRLYEALFFQVTDHLHAQDWITLEAIRWWHFNPATGRDAATVLRAYAYHGGPILLDAVLPYLLGDRMQTRPSHDAATPEGRLERAIRLAILVETLPGDAKTETKLVKLRAELLENARTGASAARNRGVMVRNGSEVLDKLAADVPHECSGLGRAASDDVPRPDIRETA